MDSDRPEVFPANSSLRTHTRDSVAKLYKKIIPASQSAFQEVERQLILTDRFLSTCNEDLRGQEKGMEFTDLLSRMGKFTLDR